MLIKKNYTLSKHAFIDRLSKQDQRSYCPGYSDNWKILSGVTNDKYSEVEKVWHRFYPKDIENA